MDEDSGIRKVVVEATLCATRDVLATLRKEGWEHPKEYFTAREAGTFLGLTPKALEHMRQRGEGPRARRWGKLVRYSLADLREWAERGAQE